jgi:hypothetical protein
MCTRRWARAWVGVHERGQVGMCAKRGAMRAFVLHCGSAFVHTRARCDEVRPSLHPSACVPLPRGACRTVLRPSLQDRCVDPMSIHACAHAPLIPDIERQDVIAACQLDGVDHAVQCSLHKKNGRADRSRAVLCAPPPSLVLCSDGPLAPTTAAISRTVALGTKASSVGAAPIVGANSRKVRTSIGSRVCGKHTCAATQSPAASRNAREQRRTRSMNRTGCRSCSIRHALAASKATL